MIDKIATRISYIKDAGVEYTKTSDFRHITQSGFVSLVTFVALSFFSDFSWGTCFWSSSCLFVVSLWNEFKKERDTNILARKYFQNFMSWTLMDKEDMKSVLRGYGLNRQQEVCEKEKYEEEQKLLQRTCKFYEIDFRAIENIFNLWPKNTSENITNRNRAIIALVPDKFKSVLNESGYIQDQ